tara:strand:- start:72 stop:245 length:174 start_codon:yes stop_codon:yes gene_type:complete
MIEGFVNPMDKDSYRRWTEHVVKHNHDNPNNQIAYEVMWKDDTYKVKILDLKVDNEG